MRISGRYEILDEIGHGAMGAVYRARDNLGGNIVALKQVLIAEGGTSPISDEDLSAQRLALIQEFRILASMRHPNIISVLDFGFDKTQTPFITMDFLEKADNFKQATESQALNFQVILFIELLLAIDYLHRRGILHRDVKPGNVLVAGGQVKVLDFGLAVAGDIAKGRAGTLAYMAPETLKSGIALKQSDLFSAGVMLYEVISGKLPYNPEDVISRISQALNLHHIDEHPLNQVLSRLLMLDPEDRYPDARAVIHAVCEAMSMAIPEETREVRESYLQTAIFVGRDAELGQLENALESAVEGKGSAWLIGGESGIGKTRLIDELRIRALVRGAIVVHGQASQSNNLPYQVWRDTLPALVLSTNISVEEASILKDLIPDISELTGKVVPDVVELEGDAYRQRLLHAISGVIQRHSEAIVIVLEDLQWLAESLVVLKHLLKFVSERPWLIVASFRNDERPELATELSGMNYLALKRLSDKHIQDLSHAMLGEVGVQANVLDLLIRETEGNAFFMVEVVRTLAEDAGGLDGIGVQTLPARVFAGGIRQILQRRLSKVPLHLQKIMKLAAIAGRNINRELLSMASSATELDDWLIVASEAAILDIEGNQWRFAHDKLREAIIDELDDSEREALHHRIAETVEIIYSGDIGYAQMLAHLWRDAGDVQKELHYIHLASEQFINITGNSHYAIEFLQRGFECLRQNTVDNADYYYLEFSYLAGQAYTNVSEYPEAIKAYQSGLKNDTLTVEMSIKIHNGLCFTYWFIEDFQQSETHGHEAFELAKNNNNQSGMAFSLSLLGRVHYARGNFDIAREYHEQSLAISTMIDDKLRIANSVTNIGTIFYRQGDYDTAREYLERSLKLLREQNFHWSLSDTLSTLGIIARAIGDYQLALSYLEESLKLRRDTGDSQGVAVSLNNLAAVHYLLESYEISEKYYQEALNIFETIDNKRNAAYVLKNMGEVAFAQEDYELAHDYHMRSLQLRREIGDQWGIAFSLGYIAQTHASLGRLDEAKDKLIESLKLGEEVDAIACTLHLLLRTAYVMYYRGQFIQAVEYLYLATSHEAFLAPMQAEANKLSDQLENILEDRVFEGAKTQGKNGNITTIIPQLITVLLDGSNSG